MRTPFLVGKRIYLRSLERADLPYLRVWANDPEIRRLTAEVRPMSEAGADEFYERVRTDQDRVWFVVALRETDQIIGEVGLLRIFTAWRAADLSIIIGEKGAWGQGYGTEAIRLLMDYAFGALNLHRLAIGVVGFNERALRFYAKVGFKQEGLERDGYYLDHRYHDFVMMSILEHEFRALFGPEPMGSLDQR